MLLLLPSGSTRAAGSGDAFAALVAAAKAEGSVVVDGPPNDAVRNALTTGFQDKYGIPVSYISSGSGPSAARVRAERAAGKYLLDVFVSGSDTPIMSFLPSGWLDRIEPALIEPDVVNGKDWKDGHLCMADPNHNDLRVLVARIGRADDQHQVGLAQRNHDVEIAARPEVEGQAAHQRSASAGGGTVAKQLLLHAFRARFREEALYRSAAGLLRRRASGRADAGAGRIPDLGRR